jgi:hypothetical protein
MVVVGAYLRVFCTKRLTGVGACTCKRLTMVVVVGAYLRVFCTKRLTVIGVGAYLGVLHQETDYGRGGAYLRVHFFQKWVWLDKTQEMLLYLAFSNKGYNKYIPKITWTMRWAIEMPCRVWAGFSLAPRPSFYVDVWRTWCAATWG